MGPFREAWHGLSIENGVYSAARRIDRSKMPPKVKKVKKKVAPAPYTQASKPTPKKAVNVLIEKRPKNFGIGSDVQPKRDQTRFVRWPKYVRLQRQKRILYQRLKVPPSINQFTQTLDQQTATQLFKLLHKYRPETNAEKKVRLTQLAEKNATAIAVTSVKQDDKDRLEKLSEAVRTNYNERVEEIRRNWGGGIMGGKSQAKMARIEKAKAV